MLKSIACPWQRRRHVNRYLILSVCIFMITTGFLYAIIESNALITHQTTSPSSSQIQVVVSLSDSNCEINNDTRRAIDLAPSDYCKVTLKEIACRIAATPNFFPSSLPRFCPITNGHNGDLIGCVQINNNSLNISDLKPLTNVSMCIDHCLKYSVSYAGFNEFTNQCDCLSKFDDRYLLAANQTCQERFSENRNDVKTLYRTGYADFGISLQRRSSVHDTDQTTIVFLLTVGGRRNLRQIKRLLRAIYAQQHYYLIHVDRREDYLYRELSNLSRHFSNIQMASRRYPTTWGSSTLLGAHLDAFKQLFEELKWNFSFILNLSESDFPLKPIPVLTNFLSLYKSYNFLRTHNREPFKFIRAQGMLNTFVHCEEFMYRIGERPLIRDIVYDGGSDWYVLNRDFVYYITYGNDELVRGLRHTFNYSLLPCEAFFHTVLSNSIYCDSYIRNNLRLVHWNRERGCKCQHKHVVDWCGCSPIVYRMVDKNTLNATMGNPWFFARKFDSTIDETILDWLDERISKRDFSNGAFYLQNVYHADDQTNIVEDVLNEIDMYTRTKLQERRKNSRDDTIQLEQIHAVFALSVFQGYALQYKFHDGTQFELFMKPTSIRIVQSNQLKRFEVGSTLDSKEIVFTDHSRTFVKPKLIKVLVEWEHIVDDSVLLIITNPDGIILRRINLVASNQPLILDIAFPVISSPSMIGIWQMDLVVNHTQDTLASLTFLVLLHSSSDEQSNIEHTTALANFWTMTEICSTIENQTNTIPIQNCFQQRWSVFYYDVKSEW